MVAPAPLIHPNLAEIYRRSRRAAGQHKYPHPSADRSAGSVALVALDGAWATGARIGASESFSEGHTAGVSAVAFSPDGKRVLTGSKDHTAPLWDAATDAAVATLTGHTAAVWAVAFSPDGKRVLTGSNDHTARPWDLFSTAQDLIEKVKASVPRCLTLTQRDAFHLGTPTPRWCYTRNLWPFAENGHIETAAANSPYLPPAMTWDERLIPLWDRSIGWLDGPDTPITLTARNGTKSP